MLTGYENLKLHSLLYGVSRETRERRISEVLELVGLTHRRNDQVKKYSGGMRRRLEIARGLIHKPKVIFLDEPTLGLDPSSREIMWKYIDRLAKDEKITLILTTHYMEEADFLCNRIGFIDKGKIIAVNSPSRLKESLGGEIIEIALRNQQEVGAIDGLENLLKQYNFVHKVELNEKKGNIVIYVEDASHDLPIIIKAIDNNSNNNNNVKSVDFRRPTLNDVFLKFTGRNIMIQQEDPAEGGFTERYAQYGNK
jgi:ABC-2 type transport system ATP-binding protein